MAWLKASLPSRITAPFASTTAARLRAPVRLLRIQAADFLAAVTGSPDGRALASEISAGHLARDAARRTTR